MIDREIKLLDGEFNKNIKVPGSYEEFDNLLGELGACLAEGSDNIVYRNTAPRIYSAVSAKVAELGFSKGQATNRDGSPKTTQKTKKGENGAPDTTEEVPVTESDTDHLRRFNSSSTENSQLLDTIFEEVCSAIAFFVEGRQGGGASKVSKGCEEAANQVFAAEDGAEKAEKIVSKIEAVVPGYKAPRVDGAITADGLARAIQAHQLFKKREAEKESKALLVG